MKNLLLVAVLLMTFLIPTYGTAQVIAFDGHKTLATFPQADAKQVVLLLSHIHELPTKADFERTPDAHLILTALANSGDDFVRDNAVVALATYWPSGDLYLLMAQLIASPSSRFATKIKVMNAFGQTFGNRALPVLKVYLDSPDFQLRLSAIQAIGLTDSKEGFELLNDVRKSESNRVILEAIDRHARLLR